MEPLADPLDDRMWKEVIPPPVLPLDTALLFPTSGNDLLRISQLQPIEDVEFEIDSFKHHEKYIKYGIVCFLEGRFILYSK